MHRVFLSIGSNIGEKEKNCFNAIKRLKECGLIINKLSPVYITNPWGITNQPDFANMAVETFTDFLPAKLLYKLKQIEKKMGRKPTIKYGPRLIDIDIIFYDELVYNSDELIIPHPLMHKRYFVLKPMNDIASDFLHPVFKLTIKELLDNF
ncbi:2-amino-4-hydroxy-6-hydroxymethyldihydropteridine diphosphokinase [Thermodesulfovibrio thiophilus]|uniref:2-amino-4-hydroxy-6- hydroxymethyldihydropteridine diphosphokinase n=1 Tax=Thermodesulfovibrio thiophilus TaxID=340095 RepID=UPI001795F4D0|nr:2-amino-4-hydroxy-6-hydroxymethyldihydropteridine diphosphokinase [Thermodesulfovibrio thiophilus]HHW21000.1 2-amino-4-hydroxy-6-hydroxymethyldihydropteridine diphosphokinase [Thermodesulfovibrio thiophilus]